MEYRFIPSPQTLGAPASRWRIALKDKKLAAETAALPGNPDGSVREFRFRRVLPALSLREREKLCHTF
jgi:hypothetical protein